MIEESSYITLNDGSLLVKPSILDLIKEHLDYKQENNNHIVYLFVNKNSNGIKFYDLNKTDNTSKKYLEFVTKKSLVFEVEWSYLINYPNKSMVFKSDIGNIRIDTYMITKKELFGILNSVRKEENNDNLIKIKIKTKKN